MHDFYKGVCAVSKKQYGSGCAYYLACDTENDFLHEFYKYVLRNADVSKIIGSEYVKDVMVKQRGESIFIMNFSTEERTINASGKIITLSGYDYAILN